MSVLTGCICQRHTYAFSTNGKRQKWTISLYVLTYIQNADDHWPVTSNRQWKYHENDMNVWSYGTCQAWGAHYRSFTVCTRWMIGKRQLNCLTIHLRHIHTTLFHFCSENDGIFACFVSCGHTLWSLRMRNLLFITFFWSNAAKRSQSVRSGGDGGYVGADCLFAQNRTCSFRSGCLYIGEHRSGEHHYAKTRIRDKSKTETRGVECLRSSESFMRSKLKQFADRSIKMDK